MNNKPQHTDRAVPRAGGSFCSLLAVPSSLPGANSTVDDATSTASAINSAVYPSNSARDESNAAELQLTFRQSSSRGSAEFDAYSSTSQSTSARPEMTTLQTHALVSTSTIRRTPAKSITESQRGGGRGRRMGYTSNGTPRRRAFPVSYSLFPIPYSLFPIPCSLFPVPCSLFSSLSDLQTVKQRKQHNGNHRVADGAKQFCEPSPFQIEAQQNPIGENKDRARKQ